MNGISGKMYYAKLKAKRIISLASNIYILPTLEISEFKSAEPSVVNNHPKAAQFTTTVVQNAN